MKTLITSKIKLFLRNMAYVIHPGLGKLSGLSPSSSLFKYRITIHLRETGPGRVTNSKILGRIEDALFVAYCPRPLTQPRRGSRILKWGVNFCNIVIFYRAKAWLRCLRSVQRRALKELINVNNKEIILKKADKAGADPGF